MSQICVITAVGKDQPGIVAALSKTVYDLGGNLDDATMTQLHNTFATMLSMHLPVGCTPETVRTALAPVGTRLNLAITVLPVEAEDHEISLPDHMVTVYGGDKPGIVYRVTERLAAEGINVTDMKTRLVGSEASPVYILMLEVTAGERSIKEILNSLRSELGVEIAVRNLNTEAL